MFGQGQELGQGQGQGQRVGRGPRGGVDRTIGDVAAEVAAAFGFGNRTSGSGPQNNISPFNNQNNDHNNEEMTVVLTSEKTSFSSVKGWGSTASLSNKRYYGSLPMTTEEMVEKVSGFVN